MASDLTPCPLGDIRAACLDCLHETPTGPDRADPVVVTARLYAAYPGQCRGCNLPIHEGQRLARLSDETYVHEGCEP